MKQAGIYAIVHRESGRCYVGSSIDVPYRLRKHREELRRGNHHNGHLLNAWRKYGESAFSFGVIEPVDDVCLLAAREQWHTDARRPNVYNIGVYTDCPTRGTKASETTRRKMTESRLGHTTTPETRAKIAAANRGRKLSVTCLAALRAANIGRKASAETRAKMSAAQAGRKCPKSPEHREKIRLALLGRKLSEEHRAKLRVSQRGRQLTRKPSLCPTPIPMTDELVVRLSEMIRYDRDHRRPATGAAGRKGIPLTEKHRLAIRSTLSKPEVRARIGEGVRLSYLLGTRSAVTHRKPHTPETIQKMRDAAARRNALRRQRQEQAA